MTALAVIPIRAKPMMLKLNPRFIPRGSLARRHPAVLRGGAGFRDHERDRITDMTRAVGCQRVARRHDHRCDASHRHCARQRTEIRQVRRSEYSENPGHCACRRSVDASDRGVRVWRTHDLHPRLTWKVDILDEAPASGQEARVLQPTERLADEGHSPSLSLRP